MTVDEIRAAIAADPAIRALLPAAPPVSQAQVEAVAAALSAGRVRYVKTAIGPGTILAELGQAGADLLDQLEELAKLPAHNMVKHALRVIDRGEFDMGVAASRAQVAGLAAAGVMSAAARDALLALGQEPDPLSARDVAVAITNDDGSLAV